MFSYPPQPESPFAASMGFPNIFPELLLFSFGAGLKLIPRATDDETPPGNGTQA